VHKLEHALLMMAEKTNEQAVAGALSYLASISHNYAPPEREDLDIPDGHNLLMNNSE
jgi:hypothetical protein